MNILEKICLEKRKEVEKLKKEKSIDFLKKNKKKNKKTKNFLSILTKKNLSNYNLIAEIKKKSPSAGLIRKNFDHVKIAQYYKRAGAKCLSILTEKNFFGGQISFIGDIKNVIDIPILRKDFIIDEWQIYESYYYGADCILIILSVINDKQAKKFLEIANVLGIDVIVEIHNLDELDRAIKLESKCIGINNRNLKTLEININLFKNLSKIIPNNILKICESGISLNSQLRELDKFGADAFLIGEFLMKQENIFKSTKNLIKK